MVMTTQMKTSFFKINYDTVIVKLTADILYNVTVLNKTVVTYFYT